MKEKALSTQLPAMLCPITRSTRAPSNAERLAAFRIAWALQSGPQYNRFFLGPELGRPQQPRPVRVDSALPKAWIQ